MTLTTYRIMGERYISPLCLTMMQVQYWHNVMADAYPDETLRTQVGKVSRLKAVVSCAGGRRHTVILDRIKSAGPVKVGYFVLGGRDRIAYINIRHALETDPHNGTAVWTEQSSPNT